MIDFLLQLPQNLLGLFILLINKNNYTRWDYTDENNDISICFYNVKHLFNSGICLGRYIIFDLDAYVRISDIKHEYGHQIQSKKYKWLYLFIIGIPSLLGNIYSRIFHKNSKWYYNQPWEKEADKLGNVKRNYI